MGECRCQMSTMAGTKSMSGEVQVSLGHVLGTPDHIKVHVADLPSKRYDMIMGTDILGLRPCYINQRGGAWKIRLGARNYRAVGSCPSSAQIGAMERGRPETGNSWEREVKWAQDFFARVLYIEETCEFLGIAKLQTMPYHPKGNGMIELLHRTIGHCKKCNCPWTGLYLVEKKLSPINYALCLADSRSGDESEAQDYNGAGVYMSDLSEGEDYQDAVQADTRQSLFEEEPGMVGMLGPVNGIGGVYFLDPRWRVILEVNVSTLEADVQSVRGAVDSLEGAFNSVRHQIWEISTFTDEISYVKALVGRAADTVGQLSSAESRYSTIERELLGVVWAIEHFRPYLFGREFLIRTDHKPLVWVEKHKEKSARMTRWKERLAANTFRITHTKGVENVIPDILSRQVNAIDDEDLTAELRGVGNPDSTWDPHWDHGGESIRSPEGSPWNPADFDLSLLGNSDREPERVGQLRGGEGSPNRPLQVVITAVNDNALQIT
ncbi:hypothetical protein AAG570_007974 [Ranatra chinensis]|uniref:Reverse transcriptase RNase H-like domain-containing protein n=1 Tax=Ranatra chinensis TaxID=642074 RepID=A0ABD0Y8N1_9HEMI